MRAKRTDANQTEIVKGLRADGWDVAVTSSLGKGFGDIVAGKPGINVIVEIKNGKQPPSKQKLTPAEDKFHDKWRGPKIICKSLEDALRKLGEFGV